MFKKRLVSHIYWVDNAIHIGLRSRIFLPKTTATTRYALLHKLHLCVYSLCYIHKAYDKLSLITKASRLTMWWHQQERRDANQLLDRSFSHRIYLLFSHFRVSDTFKWFTTSRRIKYQQLQFVSNTFLLSDNPRFIFDLNLFGQLLALWRRLEMKSFA